MKLALVILAGCVALLCLLVYVRNPDLLSLGSPQKAAQDIESSSFSAAAAPGGGTSTAEHVDENGNAVAGSSAPALPAMDIQEACVFFGTHTAALLYLHMLVTTTASMWAFACLTAALFLTNGLYAYSLIAPQFMSDARDFY